MWKIAHRKAAAATCVSFVFYLGSIFKPSRRSSAPATSMSLLVSSGIQMRASLGCEELCDFHLMRLRIAPVWAGKARLRWPLTPHNHQSLEPDRLQTTERSGGEDHAYHSDWRGQNLSAWAERTPGRSQFLVNLYQAIGRFVYTSIKMP